MTHRPLRPDPDPRAALDSRMIVRLVAALLVLLGVPLAGSVVRGDPPAPADADADAQPATRPEEDETMSEARRAEHLESFDVVWRTIRDQHYDPELRGVDWEAAREELRPKIEQAADDEEVRAILRDLVSRLDESHFAILDAEASEAIAPPEEDDDTSESAAEAGLGWIGLEARLFGDEVIVTRVDPGGPAAEAGIRPGWRLVSIAEREVADLVAAVRKAVPGTPTRLETAVPLAIRARLAGAVGKAVALELVDDAGTSHTLDVERTGRPGWIARIGELPPMPVAFETRVLDGGIRYITFDAFAEPVQVMPAFNAAMRDSMDAPGVVIDMRGNVGGLMGMLMGVGGWFVEEPTSFGTLTVQGTELRIVASPRARPYAGPVAVLVDAVTISAAEFLAGGMQATDRARVFGRRTAGLALPSQVMRLPNGDALQYVFGDYVSADGRRLERDGVAPDEVIDTPPSRDQRDPVLSAARAWIRAGNAAGRSGR